MTYSGHQIYQKMHENAAGTQQLEAASEAAKSLSHGYQDLSDKLQEEQDALSEFWTGKGAESASAGLKPLQDANIEYMGNLDQAKLAFNGVTHSFNSTRPELRPMSAERPQPSITSFQVKGKDEAQQWDEDNKHNIQQYQGYHDMQQMSLKNFPREYKPFDAQPPDGKAEPTEPATSVGPIGSQSYPGVGGGSSGGAPGASGGTHTAGGSYTPPPSMPGSTGQAAGPQSPSPSGPAQAPAAQQSPAAQWQPPENNGSTSTAGHVPTGPSSGGGFGPGYGPGVPGAPAGGSSGAGGGAGYSTTGGFGPTGTGGGYSGTGGGYSGGGYGSTGGGYRSGGGFGPRGNPDAPAAGGRTSGATPYGSGSGNSVSRGYSAPTSSTGSGSSYGRAPMMGGAGAGARGSGDEEHERKYTITPDDPDDIFGGIPEGSIVTPPVIGE